MRLSRAYLCGYSTFLLESLSVQPSAPEYANSILCRSGQEGKLMSSCHVVNYLLSTYATSNMIANADADIFHYKKPKNLNAVEYL